MRERERQFHRPQRARFYENQPPQPFSPNSEDARDSPRDLKAIESFAVMQGELLEQNKSCADPLAHTTSLNGLVSFTRFESL